jgi:hypothetical protein
MEYKNKVPRVSLEMLHRRFPLAGASPNALLTLDPDLLEFLQGILTGFPLHPPERTPEEWYRLIFLLDSQWIRPTLTRLFLEAGTEFQPPDDIMQALRTEYLHSAAKGLTEDMQIKPVLTALEEKGITPLFLKGFALGRSVYPDQPMRTGSDIDLLVHPDQIPACITTLTRMGYRIPYDGHRISPLQYHHQNFSPATGKSKMSPLEVHWRLDTGFNLNHEDLFEEVFSRASWIKYHDYSFMTLDPVDHLCYSAYHAVFQHGNGIRINWLYDLYLLTRSFTDQAQWKDLQQKSFTWNNRLAVEYGLRMAQHWTPLCIPLKYADFSTWPAPSPIEKRAWKYSNYFTRDFVQSIQQPLCALPGLKNKVKYLIQFVFPPLEIMTRDFPPAEGLSLPGAYIRRWALIFRDT